MTAPRRTPLHDRHAGLGARFTDFAGWEMPVQYQGIVAEHRAVRNQAGLFDISHMGEIFVTGGTALEFLQNLCTNDLAKIRPGGALYSHLCDEKGGVIDDIFVYCLSPREYLVVVNAAGAGKDFNWMRSHVLPGTELNDRSAELGMAALQGPLAEKIAAGCFPNLPARHQVLSSPFGAEKAWICRTGYTGEDGFEIIAPNAAIGPVWDALMEAGKGSGLLPCGLGARDTLRLEVGYPLYGQDIDEDHTPLEAGLSWVVKLDKPHFIGREALNRQKSEGLKRKLTAFILTERGIPRHGSRILCGGREAGTVTSGTFSPCLQAGIALGYVPTDLSGDFSIECHSKPVPAVTAKLPFYARKGDAEQVHVPM